MASSGVFKSLLSIDSHSSSSKRTVSRCRSTSGSQNLLVLGPLRQLCGHGICRGDVVPSRIKCHRHWTAFPPLLAWLQDWKVPPLLDVPRGSTLLPVAPTTQRGSVSVCKRISTRVLLTARGLCLRSLWNSCTETEFARHSADLFDVYSSVVVSICTECVTVIEC